MGTLPPTPSGEIPTESEWIAAVNERRTRIRGVRPFFAGDKQWRVVGQKIYLPNIHFRMVPNNTPPGQAYNPFEATFRIPQSVTKTDIRSYLANIYGVKTTYIRTDNYFSPLYKVPPPGKRATARYETRSTRTYKRAVVGLVEPFYFPQAVEDMPEKDRTARLDAIEDNYGIDTSKKLQKLAGLEQTKKSADKGWHWRGNPLSLRRGTILKLVAERRAEREAQLEGVKQAMLEARRKGELSIVPKEEVPAIDPPK
jgi:large subunit ribosomal protein L23